MQIFINHQLAAIKRDSTFDFVAENRYFSGADSYTLAITFPLKDCPQNLAIFGHINRKDVVAQHLLFDCEIRDKAFVQYGSITITEINDTEVKCQFLEGRSVQNYAVTFDEIYINEMTLGYPSTNPVGLTSAVFSKDIDDGRYYLPFQWVNNYSGNMQNRWEDNGTSGTQVLNSKVAGVTYMPYLIYIVKRICNNLGYTCNFQTWEQTKFKYLICCNVLPYTWDLLDFAYALPHWTVTELFEQLEMLMNCEFDIDHHTKTITSHFPTDIIAEGGTVEIEKVVDAFSVSVESETTNYRLMQNYRYADCSHRLWKYYSCSQAVKTLIDKVYPSGSKRYYKEFNTVNEMLEYWKKFASTHNEITSTTFQRLVYCKDVKMYFILRNYNLVLVEHNGANYPYYDSIIQPVNTFCEYIADPANETKEIKIVPAWIDGADKEDPNVIFMDLPEFGSEKNYSSDEEAWADFQGMPAYIIEEGENYNTQGKEYLDKIYVGFWKKGYADRFFNYHPIIDYVEIRKSAGLIYNPPTPYFWVQQFDLSLRLDDGDFSQHAVGYKIDPSRKYTFKWIADTIPNPRALFYIRGRHYVCEKVTATFTPDGMSQLLKGDFYLVNE